MSDRHALKPRPRRLALPRLRAASGLAACLLGGLAAIPPLSGPAAEEPVLDGRYVQHEKVELVLVPTTVVDSRGRPVAGLTRDDFHLSEQGRPVPIEYFATEADAPVAIAFLLDVSGSMRQEGKLDAARRAIHAFVNALEDSDRFGLIAFADAQVTWITEFTSERAMFKRRLDVQTALGQTALFDALAASPRLVDEAIQARKAIVLLSDGLDTSSRLDAARAVEIARRASVPIYAISFIPSSADLLSEPKRQALLVLERFSRETGGTAFPVSRSDELAGAMTRIQLELRHQYVIGFKPSSGAGGYRRILLEAKRSGLRLRARTGYQRD